MAIAWMYIKGFIMVKLWYICKLECFISGNFRTYMIAWKLFTALIGKSMCLKYIGSCTVKNSLDYNLYKIIDNIEDTIAYIENIGDNNEEK